MKTRFICSLSVSLLFVTSALGEEVGVETYMARLRTVRVPELPRESARIIMAEQPDQRAAATAQAVTAAITISPPSAASVVGFLAKKSPETAGVAAGTAAKLAPEMLAEIVRAASAAAPPEIPSIVSAMCKAQPRSFYLIGVSAADVAPRRGDQVLSAITSALPALKPLVSRSQSAFVATKRAASTAQVLKYVEEMLATLSIESKTRPEVLLTSETEITMATKIASAAMGPPPGQGPPFVPGGGPPSETPSGKTIPIPPQSRNYSTP